jgi:hypothetical protein
MYEVLKFCHKSPCCPNGANGIQLCDMPTILTLKSQVPQGDLRDLNRAGL